MSDISPQLTEQVQAALAAGTPIDIQGRGSKRFMGRAATGQVLPVADHSGIVNYQPVELVMTARAGTPIADINAALAEHNQELPCESPSLAGAATIGGTLACGQSGPARPWRGSIRDLILGIRIINGKGEHLHFGGKVMKNVAGYDVSRLQVGAMGTLGVITEVSFRVLPKFAASVTLKQPMAASEAILTMNRLAAQATPLSAACWTDNTLYLRLSGTRQAVNISAKQLPGELVAAPDDFWSRLREQQLSFFRGDDSLWRFSIKSNAAHFMPEANWLIDWNGAQRWLRCDYDLNQLSELATIAGGQVSLYRGGDRHGEVMHPLDPALKNLYRRIKQAFDPQHLFNPGRLYGWL